MHENFKGRIIYIYCAERDFRFHSHWWINEVIFKLWNYIILLVFSVSPVLFVLGIWLPVVFSHWVHSWDVLDCITPSYLDIEAHVCDAFVWFTELNISIFYSSSFLNLRKMHAMIVLPTINHMWIHRSPNWRWLGDHFWCLEHLFAYIGQVCVLYFRFQRRVTLRSMSYLDGYFLQLELLRRLEWQHPMILHLLWHRPIICPSLEGKPAGI